MPVLVVVAHPDDEILGCGGTVSKLTEVGIPVSFCILSGEAEARRNRPDLKELHSDIHQSGALLGVKDIRLGGFPNISFNTVPHKELVRFIENAIESTGADIIFAHHPGDLNDDHRKASHVTQAAARLFQRKPGIPRLKKLLFMEILSSTDWAFPEGNQPFAPNLFFEIGEEGLGKKIEALRSYRGILRGFPHPRSEEILAGLAAYRGGQSGLRYAEAFQVAFEAETVQDFTR